ncbi:unnamed protein product [Pleuronectes platessa]|uniref:Uncharacterized protein n=1 Tax=Pleuronectes platessa TaxID=8262 RepID=A0A9N7TIP9_PLEPL|nr:unnamed protein product [Pleuronectes platessa]
MTGEGAGKTRGKEAEIALQADRPAAADMILGTVAIINQIRGPDLLITSTPSGPSGSSLTESQALSGLKRQGDGLEDVPPHERNPLHWPDSNRMFQGNCDYNSTREYERKRGRDDFAGRSTCSSSRGGSW